MKMTQPVKTEDSVAEFVERNLLSNVENVPHQMIPWYCAHQRMVAAGTNIISDESMIYQVVNHNRVMSQPTYFRRPFWPMEGYFIL